MERPGVLLEGGITGVQVSYLFICRTKLWLFSHNTRMEQNSDTVAIGKLIHEESYRRKKKEMKIGSINIDFIKRGDEVVLHEVKKSRKMEDSHKYQLLYYLFYLKALGVKARGVINYPLLKRTKDVLLTPAGESEMEGIIEDIKGVIALAVPPKPEKKSYCRKCSYFEFCFAG